MRKITKSMLILLGIAVFAALAVRTAAGAPEQFRLSNEFFRAEFDGRSLVALVDARTGNAVRFADESFAVKIDKEKIDGALLSSAEVKNEKERLTFLYASPRYKIKVVYELKAGWAFLSKQLFIEPVQPADFRVNEVDAFTAKMTRPVREQLPLSDGRFGIILRFSKDPGPQARTPDFSLFLLYQNPYNVWRLSAGALFSSYVPDMDWKPAYGPFVTDRVCLGLTDLSGTRVLAKSVVEWKFVPEYEKLLGSNPTIDMAEADALVECVRSFLLVDPKKSIRVHVPWCENDYQIDVASPDGWAEYRRIIDRAVELGCQYTLFTPANSELSSLKENADAWGWENLLWFAMGQKIRKGEWDPAKDPVPASLQKMLDYAKSKGIKFMVYSYPSLAFKQDPEWTKWAGDKIGGYSGADTGLRGFQDWWVDKLVSFVKKTGAGGFSFDHWWIAYEDPKATSKYAQWFGCRRILETLRRRVPDVVIDGRQQYMNFGPWTWLAGSYPHPTLTDEQPESFTAFPDLHTDRVSADRQRFAAWKYRMERFCPPEIMPGYITHQTERSDAQKVMRRDRFRPRDWDVLGWRYSLLSSIATAPFNHVVDFIPARDTDEFKALSEADKTWFRGWLDWTDKNAAVLKRVKPIIGQPRIGYVDGTAACVGDRGFVFLFNPNYRAMSAQFNLDASIGLTRGASFMLKELSPEAGKLIGKSGVGLWDHGDAVALPMAGASAVVLEIVPAPKTAVQPMLFNADGKASLRNGALILSDVKGEIGMDKDLIVLLPGGAKVSSLSLNGMAQAFDQGQNGVTAKVKFAGEAFGQCHPLWAYDPQFKGGTVNASFKIPARVFTQLNNRKESWPVPYTEDDLLAPWIGSHRLLLYVQIAEPDEAMTVAMKIDGRAVEMKKAYNSIYGHSPKRTFLGFYVDVSNLKAETEYAVELTFPTLAAGQFQGLFFENVEPEYTKEIVR